MVKPSLIVVRFAASRIDDEEQKMGNFVTV